MNLPAHVPTAIATRNEHVERIHWGSLAVVDREGTLLADAGAPASMTFFRFTLKPFQAVPFVRDGGVEHFIAELREGRFVVLHSEAQSLLADRYLTATDLSEPHRLRALAPTPRLRIVK